MYEAALWSLVGRFLVCAHFSLPLLVSGRERVGSGDRAVPDAGGVHHLLVSWSKLRPQRRHGALQRLHATARLQSAERRIVTERFYSTANMNVTVSYVIVMVTVDWQLQIPLFKASNRLWLADFNDVLTATLNLQCCFYWFLVFSPFGVNVQCLVIVLRITYLDWKTNPKII